MPGGQILIPCPSTTTGILKEQHELIESGELTIGDILNRSIINSLVELEVRSSEISGCKIALLEPKKNLPAK